MWFETHVGFLMFFDLRQVFVPPGVTVQVTQPCACVRACVRVCVLGLVGVCVCACGWVGECVCVCVRAYAHVSMSLCVRARVYVCVICQTTFL